MLNRKDRIIERDCARFMILPTIAFVIAELLAVLIPSISAFLIGDMGEQLLNGNHAAILSQIIPFLCSVILIAFVTPFAGYIQNMSLQNMVLPMTLFWSNVLFECRRCTHKKGN